MTALNIPESKMTRPGLEPLLATAGYRIAEETPLGGGQGVWVLYRLDGAPLSAADYAVAQAIIDQYDPLVSLRMDRKAALSEACQAHIVNGFTSDASGQMLQYPCKPTDQTNMAAQVTAALADPGAGPFLFMTADVLGQWQRREHDTDQIKAAGQAMRSHVTGALTTLDALRAQVDAATSEGAILAVDWPA
jgi:hypothetical protein